MKAEYCVYWLHDRTCDDPKCDGYIGVSQDPIARLDQMKRDKRVPKFSDVSILFTGPRAKCLRVERRYRPTKGIGWNIARGGYAARPMTMLASRARIGGRPRVGATVEDAIRASLAAGKGIHTTARECAVGTGTVQRIKGEMAAGD